MIPGNLTKIPGRLTCLFGVIIPPSITLHTNESPLFSGLGTIKDFYFVHSYALTTEQENITTETNYEINFCSSIRVENVFGVQFHPEKSQKAGLLVINNFLGL